MPQFRQILTDAHFRTVAVVLQDDLVRDIKGALYLLWGGVLFVLVIGCVNLANLMMVRSGQPVARDGDALRHRRRAGPSRHDNC